MSDEREDDDAARRLLGTHMPVVFEGLAPEVLQVRELLLAVGFNIVIDPEFAY